MALQIKRNSDILKSKEEAISYLQSYVDDNSVSDGEPILARYKDESDDTTTYKVILGIVTIYDDKKYLSTFEPDTIYVKEE